LICSQVASVRRSMQRIWSGKRELNKRVDFQF
jgi:hypothetical protein